MHTVIEPRPRSRERAVRWHTLTSEEVAQRLTTGAFGLGDDEATQRYAAYGPNEVPAAPETPLWSVLLDQFLDPLIYILLVAAAVSLLLGDLTDAAVILTVVLINAIIGFTQEARARREMRALSRLSALRAEVVRGGTTREIASRDLVPGDVVILASGARIPADLRLFQVRDLEVDESALTGESVPVRKRTEALPGEALVPGDQLNMVFSGTVVTRGRARGFAVRTGAETELGRIASAVHALGQTGTPLQEKMARFGRLVGVGILLLCALVGGVGLVRGMAAGEIFLVAVALAVSAIPEGLPVVLTITLAVGVHRMAQRRAIIRSLPAVEALGSTTVVGSDKTGTLTRNQMTVRAVWAAGRHYSLGGIGYRAEGRIDSEGEPVRLAEDPGLRQTLIAGVLANEADAASLASERPRGDPTELALFVAALKAGLDPLELRRCHPELDLLPFEPERRFMATLNGGTDGPRIHLKGAPEAVLARCSRQLTPAGEGPLEANAVREAAAAMASEGLRVLATAYHDVSVERLDEGALNSGFVFAGLQGLEDPVRPEAIAAVAAAREAGIRVLMLTGDHLRTAQTVGRQLGLGRANSAVEGHTLDELTDAELDGVLQEADVYARVAPEHKLRIVQRLKAQGEIVAVTGDGVNDAPALRAAHLGIAMGASGTDVAREAADMVLADDNFATITAAVEEGRVVFANIRKVTFFLLSTAVGEILTIVVAILLGWPLPFLAVQILWINLVTNGLQDVALAFEPAEPGLLRRSPRPPRESVLTPRLWKRLGGVGVVLAGGTLGMFWWTWTDSHDLALARTVALTQMVVFQFYHVFNCRSLDRSILSIPLFSNRFLFLSIVAAAMAHLAVLHVPGLQAVFRTVPLSWEQWGVILFVGTAVILGGELDKWRNRRLHLSLG